MSVTTLRLANGSVIETTQEIDLAALFAAANDSPKASTSPAATVQPKAVRTAATSTKSTQPKAARQPKAPKVKAINGSAKLAEIRALGKTQPKAAADMAAALGWMQEANAWTERAAKQSTESAPLAKGRPIVAPVPPKAEQKRVRKAAKQVKAITEKVAAATAKQDLAEEPTIEAKPQAARRIVKSTAPKATRGPKAQPLEVIDPSEFVAQWHATRTKSLIAFGDAEAMLKAVETYEADLADLAEGDNAEFVAVVKANLARLYKALDAATAA